MPSRNALLHSIHRLGGSFRSLAKAAAYARNQLDCIVAAHLGETPDPTKNGEYSVVESLAPQCRTFVDVGANRGEWSSFFLSKSAARGTLFEPGARCVAGLRERFQAANVEVVGMALGDQEGELEFVEDAIVGEGSSAAETFDPRLPIRQTTRVQCTTLDRFFGPDSELDFVKIDTEGYDMKVLSGAQQLLSGKRVRFLQFEYNSNWLGAGSSLRMAYRLLQGLGYRVFLIRSDGLFELRLEFWGDYFRYSNFFACRSSEVELLSPILAGRL